MKICTRCKIERPLNDFPPRGDNRRGSWCRLCTREYARGKYKGSNHRNEQIKNSGRKSIKRNRIHVLNYLNTHSCEICRESDPVVLDFDHIDRIQKEYSISKMIRRGFSIELIDKEISKCRVLCSNCHRRRTAEQMSYYKYL